MRCGFIDAGVWREKLFCGRIHYTMTPWRLQRRYATALCNGVMQRRYATMEESQALSSVEILCHPPLPAIGGATGPAWANKHQPGVQSYMRPPQVVDAPPM
jgi:hypothetical protein